MTDETVVGGADSMNVDTHIESESLKVVEEVATEEKGMVVAGNESMEAAAPGGMGEDSEKEEEARATGMEAAAGDKKEGAMNGSDTTRVWGQGASKGEGDEEGEGGSDSEGAASGGDDAGDKGEECSEEIPLVVVVGRTPSEEKSAGDGEDEDVIVVEQKTVDKGALREQLQLNSLKKAANRKRKDSKFSESILYMQDCFGEDYPDRIKGLGQTKTYAVRRKMVALHQVNAKTGEPLYDDVVPCGGTLTDIDAWYRHMFDHAGVLVRDVHVFLPETLSQAAPTEVYNLLTTYVKHLNKGWYFTPSLLYKPSYIDLNAPVFNSWLSNGDVVLYTPTGKPPHVDGSLDEAANALTFIGAFLHWDSRDQRAQPDVRAVFCRSISLLKTAKAIHLDQKANAQSGVPRNGVVVNYSE